MITKAKEMNFHKRTRLNTVKRICWCFKTSNWNQPERIDWNELGSPWDKDNAYDFYSGVSKRQISAFFELSNSCLSRKDFSKSLADMWTYLEHPNCDINISKAQFIEYFKAADPKYLMNEEEYKYYKSLPDEIVVYRGVSLKTSTSTKSLSWTVDFDCASWFANRFNYTAECHATVYQATIKKKYAFAFLNDRNERELVLDYKHLQNIHEIPFDSKPYDTRN